MIKKSQFHFQVFIFSLFLAVWGFVNVNSLWSAPAESDSYRLNSGFFGAPNGTSRSDQFNISALLGPGISSDFKKNGIVAISNKSNLTVTIDKSTLDFGDMKDKNDSSDWLNIMADSPDLSGYSIYAQTEGQLANPDRTSIIPPTQCNNKSPCTIYQAESWLGSQAGLGYKIDSSQGPQDFNNRFRFRPFSNHSSQEPAVQIATSSDLAQIATILTGRVIRPVKATGSTYSTVIDIIALPDL